jgi:hypothetical protein
MIHRMGCSIVCASAKFPEKTLRDNSGSNFAAAKVSRRSSFDWTKARRVEEIK